MKRKWMGLLLVPIFTTAVYGSTKLYVVEQGDTLYGISKKMNVSMDALVETNPKLADLDKIYVGERLHIPQKEGAVEPDEYQTQFLALVNAERAGHDLPPLTLNDDLNVLAGLKNQDMLVHHYFSHDSKTYGSIYTMLKNFNIPYSILGENIARNIQTPEEVFSAWIQSKSHKENILNPKFTEMGVHYLKKDKESYWTNIFIAP